MTATASVFTEAATSRFARIKEGDLNLHLHYNDVGQGAETVVMFHGSGPVRGLGELQPQYRTAGGGWLPVEILLDCPGWSKSDPVVSEVHAPISMRRPERRARSCGS